LIIIFTETCKIIYDDNNEKVVYEVVNLKKAEWKPCSKRARKFGLLNGNPSVSKTTWKHSTKFANSAEHSLKGYVDDVTLISNDITVHTSVWQVFDKKTADLYLFFKPTSYLFDNSKIIHQGIALSNGITKSITVGSTKFLGKLIDVLLSSTKRAASKRMVSQFPVLLSATDSLHICGEYKLQVYRNYIVSLL